MVRFKARFGQLSWFRRPAKNGPILIPLPESAEGVVALPPVAAAESGRCSVWHKVTRFAQSLTHTLDLAERRLARPSIQKLGIVELVMGVLPAQWFRSTFRL